LWLVVPFLMAIILYYVLFPAVRYVTLKGVDRETAAAIVAGATLVIGIAALVPTLPWLAAQAVSGQEAVFPLSRGRKAARRALARDARVAARVPARARLPRRDEPADGDFGGTYVKEHLAGAAARRGRVAARDAARTVPRVLLPARWRRFLKYLAESRAECLLRATLYMIDRVDATARAYFQGLMKLTVIDTLCLAIGLAAIGMPSAIGSG
jgi:hypothetical protein